MEIAKLWSQTSWNVFLPPGLEAENGFKYWMCHVGDKRSVFRRVTFSEPNSISSGYLFFNQSPWSATLCLGALRHLLICFAPPRRSCDPRGGVWSLCSRDGIHYFLWKSWLCLSVGIGNGLPLTSKDWEDLLSSVFKSCERKTRKCQPVSSVFVATCLCFSSSSLEKHAALICSTFGFCCSCVCALHVIPGVCLDLFSLKGLNCLLIFAIFLH